MEYTDEIQYISKPFVSKKGPQFYFVATKLTYTAHLCFVPVEPGTARCSVYTETIIDLYLCYIAIKMRNPNTLYQVVISLTSHKVPNIYIRNSKGTSQSKRQKYLCYSFLFVEIENSVQSLEILQESILFITIVPSLFLKIRNQLN